MKNVKATHRNIDVKKLIDNYLFFNYKLIFLFFADMTNRDLQILSICNVIQKCCKLFKKLLEIAVAADHGERHKAVGNAKRKTSVFTSLVNLHSNAINVRLFHHPFKRL